MNMFNALQSGEKVAFPFTEPSIVNNLCLTRPSSVVSQEKYTDQIILDNLALNWFMCCGLNLLLDATFLTDSKTRDKSLSL